MNTEIISPVPNFSICQYDFFPIRPKIGYNLWNRESGRKWTVQKGERGRSGQNGRSWLKLDGHLSQSRQSRTIVDGLLSQSGRSWVKVDGHSTKSGQSLWINLSIEVDGSKVTVQLFSFGTVPFFSGPSTFAGRPLSVFWTVYFGPRPSTFSRLDRSF